LQERSLQLHWFRVFLLTIFLLPFRVAAQTGPDIEAQWYVNANGFTGTMNIDLNQTGNFTGSFLGDPIVGYFREQSPFIFFVRTRNGQPIQAYRGVVNYRGAQALASGKFWPVALGGGANNARNTYNWIAQTQSSTGLDNPGLPSIQNGGAPIKGIHFISSISSTPGSTSDWFNIDASYRKGS
jgi:hypothetical protein